MAKGKAKPVASSDNDDYQAQSDADTLTRASEIQSDEKRHRAATEHLAKRASATQDAHKQARKQLEKNTKGRLKKAFGGPKEGGTFESEKDKEQAEMEKTVKTDE